MGCRGLASSTAGRGGGEIQRSNKNRRIKFTFEEKTFRTIVSFPAPLPVDEEEEEEEALRATPNPAPEPNTWEIRTIESRDRTNGSRNDPEIILGHRRSKRRRKLDCPPLLLVINNTRTEEEFIIRRKKSLHARMRLRRVLVCRTYEDDTRAHTRANIW